MKKEKKKKRSRNGLDVGSVIENELGYYYYTILYYMLSTVQVHGGGWVRVPGTAATGYQLAPR